MPDPIDVLAAMPLLTDITPVTQRRRRISHATGPLPVAVDSIPGVKDLWALTRGDPNVRIALLDGPVDLAHPCFQRAALTLIESLVPGRVDNSMACRHGTHLASVIFGSGVLQGLAPNCRGLIIPIFGSAKDDTLLACSQLDLARALGLALEHGADIINISGGQFSPSGDAFPLLAGVIEECSRRGVLIVAAAGNDGCRCLHVPAAHEAVLAVGAMDRTGEPLPFSNWGPAYESHAILAPGENILGAAPGGGTALGSGTSYAAAIVTGVAALLLTLQRNRTMRQGPPASALVAREALLCSAIDCSTQPVSDCRRLLRGRLNVRGSMSFITGSTCTMSDLIETAPTETPPTAGNGQAENTASRPQPPATPPPDSVVPSQVQASACACKGAPAGNGQMVYALGELGHNFVSQARMDSVAQRIAKSKDVFSSHAIAFDHQKLSDHLDEEAWHADSVTWTLNLHGTPIYAIEPNGAFAAKVYERLRDFLKDHIAGRIERVSVGGRLGGSVTLLDGNTVPIIVPDIRTMHSWTTAALARAVAGSAAQKRKTLERFLQRVYHGLRNLGMSSQERAINYVATNALLVDEVFAEALTDKMELDQIQVTRSPLCRPGSDCWDVELYFFDPKDMQTPRQVHRLTVDVSDVAPVAVGPKRSWAVR